MKAKTIQAGAAVIWDNVTETHRELYATESKGGGLLLFLDKGEVYELMKPETWREIPLLKPAEIQSVTKSGAMLRGIYYIYTKAGGCYGGHLLRREFTSEERARHVPATGATQSGTGKRGRARQDVTQSEAAALCGVTLKTVQRWDRGEGTPEGYTGRGDAVTLRAWAARRKEAATVKRALKNTVHVDCQKLSESDRWQADMKRRGAAGRRQGDW